MLKEVRHHSEQAAATEAKGLGKKETLENLTQASTHKKTLAPTPHPNKTTPTQVWGYVLDMVRHRVRS